MFQTESVLSSIIRIFHSETVQTEEGATVFFKGIPDYFSGYFSVCLFYVLSSNMASGSVTLPEWASGADVGLAVLPGYATVTGLQTLAWFNLVRASTPPPFPLLSLDSNSTLGLQGAAVCVTAWSQRPSENASSQHSGAGGPRALLVHSDMWNLFCCWTHVRALSASSLERIPVMKVLYTQRVWVHMLQMWVCLAHKASPLINKWWRTSQWTLWVVLALMSEIIFDVEQRASFCVAVSRQWPSMILLRPLLKPQVAESDQLLFVFF